MEHAERRQVRLRVLVAVEPREDVQVPGARRAARARSLQHHVRLEDLSVLRDVVAGLGQQPRRRLPGEARAAVVEQRRADGQDRERLEAVARQLLLGPDAAAQQERRRLVRPRGQHHQRRVEAAAVRQEHPGDPPAGEGQAVDERGAEHAQVPRRAPGRGRRTPALKRTPPATLAGRVATPSGTRSGRSRRRSRPSRGAARPRGRPRGTAPRARCSHARPRASSRRAATNGAKLDHAHAGPHSS